MATAPAFVSALDALLSQRDREYARDMNFALQLQNAKMAVAKENTNRAELNARTAVMASQEQRARNNQSMTDYRNQLLAPLESTQASRAAFFQTQQPYTDALGLESRRQDAEAGLKDRLLNRAIKDQDTNEIRRLTGYYAQIINNRVMISPTATGDYRDIRTNELGSVMDQREATMTIAGDAQQSALQKFLAAPVADTQPVAGPASTAKALSPVTAAPLATPAPVAPAALVESQPIPVDPNQNTVPTIAVLEGNLAELLRQRPVPYEEVTQLRAQIAATKQGR